MIWGIGTNRMANAEDLEILIVEDVDTMRDLLKHVLGGIPGFCVSGSAGNGWEARIELTRRRPGLILLDEILPGESCEDLLQEFHRAKIPVILLTGVRNPAHDVPPLALGRITKPGWKSIDADRKRLQAAILAFLRMDSAAESAK